MPAVPSQSNTVSQPAATQWRGRIILTSLFLLQFQFFFSIGKSFETHPLAPHLLMEATIGLLLIYAAASFARRALLGQLSFEDVFFFISPFLFVLISAVSAEYYFQQPLLLGVGEDRRAFFFLFWFPISDIGRHYRLGSSDVLNCLIVTALIYLLLGLGIQKEFAPELRARVIPDFDSRKLRISTSSECFALCTIIGVSLMTIGGPIRGLAAFGIGMAGLVVIAQTRQVVLSTLAACICGFIVVRPVRGLALCLAGGFSLLLVVLVGSGSSLDRTLSAMLPNMNEFLSSNLMYNTRAITFQTVTGLLLNNGLIGLGALSDLFAGGYGQIYGRNFFINDIGFLGEIFRVGLVAIAIYGVYAVLLVRNFGRLRTSHSRVIGVFVIIYEVFSLPSGWIFRDGFVHAFILMLLLSDVPCRRGARCDELCRSAVSTESCPRATYRAGCQKTANVLLK